MELWQLDKVKPYHRNPRHNEEAVPKVAKSIQEFGFRQPIVVDEAGVIIVGHTRYQAARSLGLEKVPVHVATEASGMTAARAAAYRLADNRTGEEATWDEGKLGLELADLRDLGLDLPGLTGFDDDEIRKLLGEEPAGLERVNIQSPPRMAWVLVGIPTVRFGEVASLVEQIAALPDTFVETVLNDDRPNQDR